MEEERRPEQAELGIQARIRASFERQGLMRHLGARLGHVGPGRVHIVLPNRREVNQQHGYIHAGATSAIADSAGGYAAFTLFPENTAVLTVEYKINLLAPAVGDHIEAVGTVLKSGRTLTVCQLEVFAFQGPKRSLVAAGQQTLIRVPEDPSSDDLPPATRRQHGLYSG
jgi:uncharacterized protein (TIGR00369 family)